MLPEVGSTVYALPTRYGASELFCTRVTALRPNTDGVVGPWFEVENGFSIAGLALRDEGITWTRSADPADHTAVLAARALWRAL